MERTAIEITGGTTEWTSRLSLKKAMERFGEVIGCHIGNRGVDKPVVRYVSGEVAQTAHQALRKGEIVLDGMILEGDWKPDRGRPPPEMRKEPREAEMTSRDFLTGMRARRDRRSTLASVETFRCLGGAVSDPWSVFLLWV
ncbi:unnamed protein product [Effrenium voratum]|uniref:Uncharacterized protein n=1 Tax=Effrenium voratum TaxID=2562239 RepID=A0AA36NHI7_9DINO|nr:unnamed protein product [Effrenium voratum]CAJ1431590.1 unnamed protein product [Effrenium voratum]